MRRLFTATRSLQTDVPVDRLRNSGSRVRFPVIDDDIQFVAAIRNQHLPRIVLSVPKSKDGSGAFSPPWQEMKRRNERFYAAASGSGPCSGAGSDASSAGCSVAASPSSESAGAAGACSASASGASAACSPSGASSAAPARLRAPPPRGPLAFGAVSAAAGWSSRGPPASGARPGPAWRRRCQRRRRDDRRRPRVDLEDPEAQHAVGDPKVVVQLVEQRSLGLEPEEAVVGLGALAGSRRRACASPSRCRA